jgi:hypothetical protein
MKRAIMLVITLLPSVLYAQRFKAGLLVGITTTQVDGDTYAGYNKLGFVAGGFIASQLFWNPEGDWSAAFEITYIQKGSRKVPRPDKGDYSFYKLNLNYVEVPILARYSFFVPDSACSKKLRLQIEGGISTGVLVQWEEENTNGPVTGGVPFEKVDISTVLGLSYAFSRSAFFNTRYEYSAFPVRKGPISQYYQNWTYKFLKPGYYNNVLLFSLRYQFNS